MSTQALINSIISNAINVADRKSNQADSMTRRAETATSGSTSGAPFQPPFHQFKNVEPAVHIPQHASGVDAVLLESVYGRFTADFTQKFADFFAEYFPNENDALARVQQWVFKTLDEGGSGIKPEIEEQIWQRDRGRIMRAANTAGETVLETFAARGFPVPIGAAQHQISVIQQKAVEELASSSRELAIKVMGIELDNIRFAITTVMDYRLKGIAAASEYIRTLALGPQIASDLATSSANAQAQLISAASSYYNARLKVEEMRLELRNHDFALRTDRDKHSLDMAVRQRALRAEVTSALAQSLGQQAGAALNAIHAQAGVTLNDSL